MDLDMWMSMLCIDELCGYEYCVWMNYVHVNVVYEYCECVRILYCQCFEFLAMESAYPVSVTFFQILG
jgi:hypothetical protein